MALVSNGSRVQIHFHVKQTDGTVVGTTLSMDPREFVVGSDEMPPAISHELLTMKPGDKKTIHLTSEQAFGLRREELQQTVPRAQFPSTLSVGDRIVNRHENRETVHWVSYVDAIKVILDANHPLAGQELTVELELVAVLSSAPEVPEGTKLHDQVFAKPDLR